MIGKAITIVAICVFAVLAAFNYNDNHIDKANFWMLWMLSAFLCEMLPEGK
jgi:hypothetical protein